MFTRIFNWVVISRIYTAREKRPLKMRSLELLFLSLTSVASDWSVTKTEIVQPGQTIQLRCPMDHESCIWYSSTKEPLEG